jgi:hypothetical protein
VTIRESIVAHFGAGSPVGSNIAVGRQPPPGAVAPTLAMPLPSTHLVAFAGGTLYLQLSDKVWFVVPTSMSDDDLAAYDLIGSLDSVMPPSLSQRRAPWSM